MKKRFLIAALVLAIFIPAVIIGAELMNITTAGVAGDWYIYDGSKNTICYFDATNRKLVFPSGSKLEIESGGTVSFTGFAVGKIPVSTFATTVAYSPSSIVMDGHVYRISSAQSVYLPAGPVGMNATFRTIPGTVTIYPSTNDHWQYATTTVTAGSAIQIPGTAGDYVKVVYGALSVWEVYGNVGTISVP
jgi:hypothetical protein